LDVFNRKVAQIVDVLLDKRRQPDVNRLATIAAVDGSNHATVTFDGETTPTTKYYMRAANYTPVVGDRVVMQRVNNSYVIAYKVS
jgi:hypothetical protein